MVDSYIVNKKVLRTARDIGHCPCNLVKPCPCDDFIEDNKCKCGAFTLIRAE